MGNEETVAAYVNRQPGCCDWSDKIIIFLHRQQPLLTCDFNFYVKIMKLVVALGRHSCLHARLAAKRAKCHRGGHHQ